MYLPLPIINLTSKVSNYKQIYGITIVYRLLEVK